MVGWIQQWYKLEVSLAEYNSGISLKYGQVNTIWLAEYKWYKLEVWLAEYNWYKLEAWPAEYKCECLIWQSITPLVNIDFENISSNVSEPDKYNW